MATAGAQIAGGENAEADEQRARHKANEEQIAAEAKLVVAAKMAEDALASGSPGNNPRLASKQEIIELYYAAL